MKHAVLSPRLLAAAEFVRRGAVFADVGTDHAYLPIFLLENGVIERAVCSDINRGPLQNAERNAKERGLDGKIEFLLADGAEALEGRGASDIAVCGMGGELIADIIERAPHLKNPELRLILQPMSKQSTLRNYLAKNGFKIINEAYSSEAHHSYVTIHAEYVGVPYEISPVEAEIGIQPYDFSENAARRRYVNDKLSALTKEACGKALGGREDKSLEELIYLIKNLLRGNE